MAHFYANDLLTLINVPEIEQEQDRGLLRSRQKVRKQQTELRSHILALLRRSGRCYQQETQHKSHWCLWHYSWINRVDEESSGSLKVNLQLHYN
ncbi:MAG: hypothetical protein HRU20_23060 [Pseudomonadales bacterium]|nr:hypothetical protein [Pseudomonadales bacterium]